MFINYNKEHAIHTNRNQRCSGYGSVPLGCGMMQKTVEIVLWGMLKGDTTMSQTTWVTVGQNQAESQTMWVTAIRTRLSPRLRGLQLSESKKPRIHGG